MTKLNVTEQVVTFITYVIDDLLVSNDIDGVSQLPWNLYSAVLHNVCNIQHFPIDDRWLSLYWSCTLQNAKTNWPNAQTSFRNAYVYVWNDHRSMRHFDSENGGCFFTLNETLKTPWNTVYEKSTCSRSTFGCSYIIYCNNTRLTLHFKLDGMQQPRWKFLLTNGISLESDRNRNQKTCRRLYLGHDHLHTIHWQTRQQAIDNWKLLLLQTLCLAWSLKRPTSSQDLLEFPPVIYSLTK